MRSGLWGSLRRECLDHVIALNERQVCRIVSSYARSYNHAQPISLWRRMLLSRGESKCERWGASWRFPKWADFIIDTSGWPQP